MTSETHSHLRPEPIEAPSRPPDQQFHPDDVAEAFGVLCYFAPHGLTTTAAYNQLHAAFGRAVVELAARVERRSANGAWRDSDPRYYPEIGR